MLTITVNTFENIDTKFHNDPRKTLGDMYIYFGWDLLLLHCLVLLNLQLPSNETNTSQRAASGGVFCVFADCRWLSKKWMPQDRTEKGVSWGTGVITFWQLVADWSLQDRQLLKWNEEIKKEWKKSRESEEGREERSRDVRLHSVIFCIRRV